MNQNRIVSAGAALLAILLPFIPAGAQRYPPGYVNDNSDWWSHYSHAEGSQTSSVKAQHRIPAASNLRILEISLGSLDSSASRDFSRVLAKLGKAEITARGDASTGRQQICYSSAEKSSRVHLIFEEGEVDDSFYLFAGRPDWAGSDRCVSSNLISTGLGTASGLHLGQTRQQVEAILGKPSVSESGKVVYLYEVQQRMNAEEIKRIRQQDPNIPDKYLFWFVSDSIEARFANSRLTYLAVSKSETD